MPSKKSPKCKRCNDLGVVYFQGPSEGMPCPECRGSKPEQHSSAIEEYATLTTELLYKRMNELSFGKDQCGCWTILRKLMEWNDLSDHGLRLRCGEMTAQEIRTVRSVLNCILGVGNETKESP